MLLALLILAHWAGCAFWWLSRWEVESSPFNGVDHRTGLVPAVLKDARRGVEYSAERDEAQALLCRRRVGDYYADSLFGQSAASGAQAQWAFYCADLTTKYCFSVYYTLTTMTTTGYGDIVAGTNVERTFAATLMVIGSLCVAVIFANVILLIESHDEPNRRLRSKLDDLAEYAKFNELPRHLAEKMQECTKHLWTVSRGAQGVQAALASLPGSLREEVLLHLQAGVVQKSAVFRDCGAAFVKAVVVGLDPQVYTDGSAVVLEGDVGREMFFVRSGSVRVSKLGLHLAEIGGARTQ